MSGKIVDCEARNVPVGSVCWLQGRPHRMVRVVRRGTIRRGVDSVRCLLEAVDMQSGAHYQCVVPAAQMVQLQCETPTDASDDEIS